MPDATVEVVIHLDGQGGDQASGEVQKVHQAVKDLGGGADTAYGKLYAIQRMLVGMGAPGAAEIMRIYQAFSGLSDIMEKGLGKLGLYAASLGGLAATAGAAALAIKASTDAAIQYEDSLSRVRGQLIAMGSDSQAAEAGARAFAKALSDQTGYLQGETLDAYAQMIQVLGKTDEAQKAVTAAELIARATHQDLGTVLGALRGLTYGYQIGMHRLGLDVALTRDGTVDFNKTLDDSIHKYHDAMSALDPYNKALVDNKKAINDAEIAAGEGFLPVLTEITEWIAKEGVPFFEELYSALQMSADGFYNIGQVASKSFELIGIGLKMLADPKDWRKWEQEGVNAASQLSTAFKDMQAPWHTDFFGTQGGGTGPNAGSGKPPTAKDIRADFQDKMRQVAAEVAQLKAAGKDKHEVYQAEIQDLQAILGADKNLTAGEQTQIKTRIANIQAEDLAYQASLDKRAAAQEKHAEVVEQREKTKYQRMEDAETAFTQKAIGIINKYYNDSNKANAEAWTKALDTEVKSLEEQLKFHTITYAQMEETLHQFVTDHGRSWDQIRKQLENTLTQQKNDFDTYIADQQKKAEETEKKQEELNQKQYDNTLKFAQQATNFFDQFFQKGKDGAQSFADAWKKMLQDMEKALIESFFFKMMGGGGSLGSIFTSLFSGSAGLGFLSGGVGGGGFGGGGVAPAGSQGFASAAMAAAGLGGGGGGGSLMTMLGGGGGGGAAGTPLGLGNLLGIGGAGLIGTLIGGKPGSSGSAFGGLGGIAGLLGMSAIAGGGDIMAGMAGLFASGPVGIGLALGAVLLGSLAGSLFGDHNTKQNEPDKYLQGYGQFVSDVNGAPGSFNGTEVYPESQYEGANALSNQMAQFFASNPDLTQYGTAIPDLQALKNLGPTFGIASEKNDVFTLTSGKTVKVEDYMRMVQTFVGAAGSEPVPVFNLTHSFPDYNGAQITGIGGYTAGGPAGNVGNPISVVGGAGGPVATGSSGPGVAGSGGAGVMRPVVVNVNVGGTVVSNQNLANYISQAVAQAMTSNNTRSPNYYGRS